MPEGFSTVVFYRANAEVLHLEHFTELHSIADAAIARDRGACRSCYGTTMMREQFMLAKPPNFAPLNQT